MLLSPDQDMLRSLGIHRVIEPLSQLHTDCQYLQARYCTYEQAYPGHYSAARQDA